MSFFFIFIKIKLLQTQLAELKAASGVDRRHLEIPTQDDLEDIRRQLILLRITIV